VRMTAGEIYSKILTDGRVDGATRSQRQQGRGIRPPIGAHGISVAVCKPARGLYPPSTDHK